MKSLNLEPCLPPKWAPSGHAQTVLGHVLRSPLLPDKGERVEIELPDGDRLVGFLLRGNSNVLVYLFHGLAGSVDSTYIHRTALVARAEGHSVLMMNHRGCGAGSGMAKGPYHSGSAEDLGEAIAYGKKHFPNHTHLAIGFSLSGNALLLLLSGRRGNTKPDLAVSVNAPIDLSSTSHALAQGFNRVYDIRFYLQCRRDIMASLKTFPKEIRLPRLVTLRDLDNLYTAPFGGFKDRDDYYSSCSTAGLLQEITTPTVILTADDDPFVDSRAYHESKPSKAVTMHIEKFGGHMGYLSRMKTPLGTIRWQDYALRESMKSLLNSY